MRFKAVGHSVTGMSPHRLSIKGRRNIINGDGGADYLQYPPTQILRTDWPRLLHLDHRVWRSSLVAAVRLAGLGTVFTDDECKESAEAVQAAMLSGARLGACCRGKEVLVGFVAGGRRGVGHLRDMWYFCSR
jgi:hypothetical protein